MQGQNHWAFDFVLVVGEGYQSGLAEFMTQYHSLFSGVIWTGLNIDYPGHSFSHLGLFYGKCPPRKSTRRVLNIHIEGTNGRLPNQDVINTVSKVAQYTGQVPVRYHNIPDQPLHRIPWVGRYLLAAKHLLHHFAYAALGRSSAGHGPLAKCVPPPLFENVANKRIDTVSTLSHYTVPPQQVPTASIPSGVPSNPPSAHSTTSSNVFTHPTFSTSSLPLTTLSQWATICRQRCCWARV